MSSPIDVVAILRPKPGKTDRVVELLTQVSEYIKANEPGTLRYHIHREVNKKSGADEVIMLETYKNKEAIGIHGSSSAFKEFGRKLKEEGLIEGPPEIKLVKEVGGFKGRL